MKINKIEGFILALLSAFILYSSYKNHIVIDGFLSAGLFPFIVGVLMFVLSIVIFLNNTNALNTLNYKDIINTLLLLSITAFLFFILFNIINFYILSGIYMIIVLLLLREQNILKLLLIPAITNVSIYLIFSLSLKIL